jgi:arylsulfatase A-like enzyme
MHDTTGVVIFWGKDIARGRELTNANVVDITPTVLALYGLPVADDMDGRVLTEAIDEDFLASHRVHRIDSYETAALRQEEGEEPMASPYDDQVRERLRSLGYIE